MKVGSGTETAHSPFPPSACSNHRSRSHLRHDYCVNVQLLRLNGFTPILLSNRPAATRVTTVAPRTAAGEPRFDPGPEEVGAGIQNAGRSAPVGRCSSHDFDSVPRRRSHVDSALGQIGNGDSEGLTRKFTLDLSTFKIEGNAFGVRMMRTICFDAM